MPTSVDKTKIFKKPNKKYIKKTKLADWSATGEGASVPSVTVKKGCGSKDLTITFAPVPLHFIYSSSWGSWGAAPFTEGDTPPVHLLYSNGSTSMTLNFSCPLKRLGFEIEPNPFQEHKYNVVFGGPTDAPSCTFPVTANGSAGARLAAAQCAPGFSTATVTDTGGTSGEPAADFAIARIRTIAQ